MHYEDRTYITASSNGTDAEKSASNTVVDFIADHYPFLLKTQKEFYISRSGDLCTCGIKIYGTMSIKDTQTARTLTVPKGLYAVLEGSCYGSGNEYEQVLLAWLRDNGFEAAGTTFSVYDTSKGTGQNDITVKSQVMIKDGRI